METSLRGASTAAAWADWDRENVAIDGDAVTIQTDSLPTYASGREAAVDDAAIADVALAPCGDPYLLTEAGALYRYDPERERVEELSCVWQATGDPQTLCVTTATIYVAGTEPGAVQAISRYGLQTRWIAREGVDRPIALCRCDGDAYLLDGAEHRAAASILRVETGRLQPVVEGLMAPLDLASGPDGRLWVLDALVGVDPGPERDPVIRRFEASSLSPGDPVTATDSIHLVPAAFEIHKTGEPVPPACLAVGSDGELLVGVGSSWRGQQAVLRYLPSAAAFERQPGLEAGTVGLSAANNADEPRAYALDGNGNLYVLDGEYRTRRNPAGSTAGTLRTRFEASEEGVTWHRVHLERALRGTENEVRVRYAATDAPKPEPVSEVGWDAPDLESLYGLGPTYAARLRSWGIEDLADLAERSAAAVQSMVSVEEVDVAESTVADWQSTAQSLIDGEASPGSDVDRVDGIGPTYAERLRAGNVPDLGTLVQATPAAIARIVSAGTLDVPLSRTAAWVQAARDQRPEHTSVDDLPWTAITPSSPEDALFEDAVGRYCWIELELLGTAGSAPTVEACRVEFPRSTYLEELPAIYRADAESADRLERYLSLFERLFTDVEADIEDLTRYLDPQGIPDGPDALEWLGAFLGMDVDGAWPTPVARNFVDRAPELYRWRGTRRGLRLALSIYLDHVEPPTRDWGPAIEQEAAQLDRLAEADRLTAAEVERARQRHHELATDDPAATVRMRAESGLACADEGPAREFYERFLPCPEGFLVMLHPRVADDHVRALSRIVAAQAPAHAQVRTVGLGRGVQLSGTCEESDAERGYHTYLGVNSTLVDRSFALDDAGLGEETVLDTHEPDGQLGVAARLDADAHIS